MVLLNVKCLESYHSAARVLGIIPIVWAVKESNPWRPISIWTRRFSRSWGPRLSWRCRESGTRCAFCSWASGWIASLARRSTLEIRKMIFVRMHAILDRSRSWNTSWTYLSRRLKIHFSPTPARPRALPGNTLRAGMAVQSRNSSNFWCTKKQR